MDTCCCLYLLAYSQKKKKGGGGVKDNLSFKDICECALPIPQEHTHFFWKMIFAATLKNKPLVWWESIGKEIIYWSCGMWCVFPLIHCLSKQPIAGWIEYLSSRCFGQGGSALFFKKNFYFSIFNCRFNDYEMCKHREKWSCHSPQTRCLRSAVKSWAKGKRVCLRVWSRMAAVIVKIPGAVTAAWPVCVCVIVNAFIYCGVFLSMFSANEWRL